MRDPRELPQQESRYPGYDVLSKRAGPSWNEQTRRVIARRLSVDPEPRFFTAEEFKTVGAIAARIVPQSAARPPIPVAALVDRKLYDGVTDGYRAPGMPRDPDAWRLGLKALEAEARAARSKAFRMRSRTCCFVGWRKGS
jgi:Gluconate 2-dehydrogenase subunit 3